MTLLALLRHARTDWNRHGRMQGRADIPLPARSRDELAALRVPEPYGGFRALCSPLARCRETAALLGLAAHPDPRLIEMDWGRFEGCTLAGLRERLGPAFAANEARGLDFRPDGGESPRDVQARVAPLLAEIAAGARPTLAVTHRGVIRAVYALAAGWDMTGAPPHALDSAALQVFSLARDGAPSLHELNRPLERR